MKSKLIYSLLFVGGLLSACSEDPVGQQPLDSVAPAPPSNVLVENLNGAAIIRYDVPKDIDLMYVKASYLINGVEMEARSSVYGNELKVEGFGDTLEYDVALASVDRSRNESEPLYIKVKPLLSPVQLIFQSLEMIDGFGGVGLTWKNPGGANIVISFMAADSTGEMADAENFYTALKQGSVALRGFDTIPRNFAVYIRDRWDNYSDTLVQNHIPLFEKQLAKSKFDAYDLPGDTKYSHALSNLWDGVINGESGFFHTGVVDNMPTINTFSLGVKAKLSRFKYWQRPLFFYTHNNPRVFELWGSNAPNPDGSLDGSWVLLQKCVSFQPSGQGPGKVSNEDKEFAEAGEEFEFPLEIPVVKYIRLVVYETWGGSNITQGAEIAFWGQDVD